MKKIIKESISELLADRYLAFVCVLMALLAIAFSIYIVSSVRPSDLQLVSHYSAFGTTHLYRDQWYYLLSFGVFGLGISLVHIAVVAKILTIKGRSLALSVAWLGVAMITLAWMTAYAVLNVWSPI